MLSTRPHDILKSRYAFQAVVLNEFGSGDYTPQVRDVVFKYTGVEGASIKFDLAMLVVLLLGFRLLAYLFLLIRAKRALV